MTDERRRRARMAHEIREHQALNVAGLAWAILLTVFLTDGPAIVRALWGLTR